MMFLKASAYGSSRRLLLDEVYDVLESIDPPHKKLMMRKLDEGADALAKTTASTETYS